MIQDIPDLREIVKLVLMAWDEKKDPEWKLKVQLSCAYAKIELDDLHHAPMCPANHYEFQRVPGPRCTCGARAAMTLHYQI